MSSSLILQAEKLQKKVLELTSLIEVSAIISSTLEIEELIKLVMEKAQTVMNAEASSIMLLNKATNLLECQFALGTVQDQVKGKMQLKLGQGIAGWVAEKGEPIIVPDVNSDPRFYAKVDQLTGFTTRSILAVPLKVKGEVIGVAEVLNRLDGESFTEDNLELFSTFCRQVALAIENAKVHQYRLEQQRLQQQLEAAHIIQQSFMPQSIPHSPDERVQLFGKNIPATSVGGDLFDVLALDNNCLGFAIGDVSGKGIPAALYMARLVSDLRYYSRLKGDAVETMNAINKLLLERSRGGMFVTLQYMTLDCRSGRLSIVNGGHLPALLINRQKRTIQWLQTPSGLPLGILPDTGFETFTIQLIPDDYIVMFTDGVIETKNRRGSFFSRERLEKIVNEPWSSPVQVVELIIERVLEFSQGLPQQDDITILAFRWC